MSNIGSYEEQLQNFDWSLSERELDYAPGDRINIGWYCTDRICQMGKADKIALIWEGMGDKSRTYTFNDIRLAANTIGSVSPGSGNPGF